MARLKAHGTELARRETPTGRIAVMSDGNIMRNYGTGWKLWRKLKAGVDPVEYARQFDERTRAMLPELRAYIQALQNACTLERRWWLHENITLMPTDPDGVWSHCDEYGHSIDIEDIVRACRLYQACEAALRERGAQLNA
jgi:hypothetical protein